MALSGRANRIDGCPLFWGRSGQSLQPLLTNLDLWVHGLISPVATKSTIDTRLAQAGALHDVPDQQTFSAKRADLCYLLARERGLLAETHASV